MTYAFCHQYDCREKRKATVEGAWMHLCGLIFIAGSNPSARKRTIPPWQWGRQLMMIMLWGWSINDRALVCVFMCATSACRALPTVCLEIIEPLNKCFVKHTEIHKMGSAGHVMNSNDTVRSHLHATQTLAHVSNNTNCPCFYLSSLAKWRSQSASGLVLKEEGGERKFNTVETRWRSHASTWCLVPQGLRSSYRLLLLCSHPRSANGPALAPFQHAYLIINSSRLAALQSSGQQC